jgi:SAM-dependent methyltransferase
MTAEMTQYPENLASLSGQGAKFPFKSELRRWLVNPRGKRSFITDCPEFGRVLDVGCGHNSPKEFKSLKPHSYYVGVDVADCRQLEDPRRYADEYFIVDPVRFSSFIESRPMSFDVVISSHNLEHCDQPVETLSAMCRALLPRGRMYLSFPSELSVRFPHRIGCLNFRDDPTHQDDPPNFNLVVGIIRREGLEITYCARRYRPPIKALQGLLLEPYSALRRKVMPGTWALYGFETVIWATRR